MNRTIKTASELTNISTEDLRRFAQQVLSVLDNTPSSLQAKTVTPVKPKKVKQTTKDYQRIISQKWHKKYS
jgi:hypothetical protein